MSAQQSPQRKTHRGEFTGARLCYLRQTGPQVSYNLCPEPRISCSSGGVNTELWILIKPQSLFSGQTDRRPLFFPWLSQRKAGRLDVAENGLGKMGGGALPTSPHSFWGCRWRGLEFLGALVDSFPRSPHGKGRSGGPSYGAMLPLWGGPSLEDDSTLLKAVLCRFQTNAARDGAAHCSNIRWGRQQKAASTKQAR